MARLLDHVVAAFTGNQRQTSDRILSIAQRGVKKPATLTEAEIKSVCASVVSQARK